MKVSQTSLSQQVGRGDVFPAVDRNVRGLTVGETKDRVSGLGLVGTPQIRPTGNLKPILRLVQGLGVRKVWVDTLQYSE